MHTLWFSPHSSSNLRQFTILKSINRLYWCVVEFISVGLCGYRGNVDPRPGVIAQPHRVQTPMAQSGGKLIGENVQRSSHLCVQPGKRLTHTVTQQGGNSRWRLREGAHSRPEVLSPHKQKGQRWTVKEMTKVNISPRILCVWQAGLGRHFVGDRDWVVIFKASVKLSKQERERERERVVEKGRGLHRQESEHPGQCSARYIYSRTHTNSDRN